MATLDEQIIERLRLCYLDITGIQYANAYAYAGKIDTGAIPYVQTHQGQDSVEWQSSEHWTATSDFIGEAYLATTATQNQDTIGAVSMKNLQPYKSRFRRYFMEHPRLSTSTLDPLAYLVENLTYRSSIVGVMPDADYLGFTFTITLTWSEIKGVTIS